MKTSTRKALRTIREKLGVMRLSPRRLYIVNDGAYLWIGDRADLSASDARALRAINSVGSDPSRATRDERTECDAADYDAICGRCACVSAAHGAAGVARWEDLPEDWQDGSALGPISPL